MIRPLPLLLSLAAAAPALADGTSKGKVIECYCTDRTGARVEMGQIICLEVDGRRYTAQCQMSLNVPMWRELQDGCEVSHAPLFTPIPTSAG